MAKPSMSLRSHSITLHVTAGSSEWTWVESSTGPVHCARCYGWL